MSEAAARERGAWRHAWVLTCHQHHVQLVALPELEELTVPFTLDLAAQLRAQSATGLKLPIIQRSASAVEIYISHRLSGEQTTCPLLEGFELCDALRLASYLGFPHKDARQLPSPRNLDEQLMWASDGLRIFEQGAGAVEARLRDIARIANPYGACETGLKRVFGSFDEVLSRSTDVHTRQLRQLLVGIGLDLSLIEFDRTELLGITLPARDHQTLESARKRFGVSSRELRAVLLELGAIPPDHADKPGSHVLFNVTAIASLLGQLKDCLNLNQASSVLGLHANQTLRLCGDLAILQPFFTRPSRDLKPLRYFRRQDLEKFMTTMTVNCQRVQAGNGALVDVWEAALKTCRQPAEIIAGIHSGQIANTFRIGPLRSIKDIRVDLEQVRMAIRATPGDDLVSAEDCARVLTINLLAMRKILKAGILKGELDTNPVNQRRQLAARRSDLKAFHETYLSLNALRLEHGSSAAAMAQTLDAAGIRPAFRTNLSEVSLYRRSEVAGAAPALERRLCEREARSPRRMKLKRRAPAGTHAVRSG